MARRSDFRDSFVVDGTAEDWLVKAEGAMQQQGFKDIETSPARSRVAGNFRNLTVAGDLMVRVTAEGEGKARVALTATGKRDNVWAAFRNPAQKIAEEFRAGL